MGDERQEIRVSLPATLVTIFIAFYIAMDSIFLQAFPGQRFVYGMIFLVAAAVLLYGLAKMHLSMREAVFCFGWLLLNSVWLYVALWQQHIYSHWLLGDLVSMMLPLILFLVAARFAELFSSMAMLRLLGAMLLIAAILGAAVGIGPNSRFESPATLLFPLAWIGFATTVGPRKVVSAMVLAVLALLTIGAGERTAMVLWLVSGIAVYSLFWPTRRVVVTGILLLVIAVAFGSAIFQMGLRDALEQTRFRQNVEGNVDASLITRLNEAKDVLRSFDEANLARKILGHGHGASLQPVYSLTLRNLSADGLMHHVHIGPALVLYRYGIIGVLVLTWLWLALIRSLLRLRGVAASEWNIPEVVFSLALLMYLVDLLLRNVIADPAFSYVAAGFLYFQSRRKVADSGATEFAQRTSYV